ncbi:hypothetical protein [Motilibacter deserti]|uniref:Excreted virulence factor EspC (Type VII ESX diderm) n=1 Tax=Motilibacter deserti TaxID=2714956 RepID=A0ABX0GYN9_9ACTN|nr:hypothetical protein [Motilibacter deserti]NHC15922.1 hypothetical protein [Motilibacter deserti]
MSGFTVDPAALEEFAAACEGASGQAAGLDPGAAMATVPAAVPETATAEQAARLGIALTVSCQAAGDAFAALAGNARSNAAGYLGADGGAESTLSGLVGAR